MDWQKLFIEHPEIVVTVLSGFLLPVILVWLNNYFNLKSKQKDREIDRNFTVDAEQISHERIIHSSLVKILFEIQKLYISLCCDLAKQEDCITNASSEFQNCFAKYQATISDNQIFLSSDVVNELYRFYNKVGEILIDLNNIKAAGEPSVARVCVYDHSQELADMILNIQEIFIQKRQKLFGDLRLIRSEMKAFRTCCGPPPPGPLRVRYGEVMSQLQGLPEPIKFKT
jgi:hypothetical protein